MTAQSACGLAYAKLKAWFLSGNLYSCHPLHFKRIENGMCHAWLGFGFSDFGAYRGLSRLFRLGGFGSDNRQNIADNICYPIDNKRIFRSVPTAPTTLGFF
jgi:hypothetical protein